MAHAKWNLTEEEREEIRLFKKAQEIRELELKKSALAFLKECERKNVTINELYTVLDCIKETAFEQTTVRVQPIL